MPVQNFFPPPHLVLTLDPRSGMDKNQDPGKTSRIRNTDNIAKDTVPADGNYVDTNVKQLWIRIQ